MLGDAAAPAESADLSALRRRLADALEILALFRIMLDSAGFANGRGRIAGNLVNGGGDIDRVAVRIDERREMELQLGSAFDAARALHSIDHALYPGSGGDHHVTVTDNGKRGLSIDWIARLRGLGRNRLSKLDRDLAPVGTIQSF